MYVYFLKQVCPGLSSKAVLHHLQELTGPIIMVGPAECLPSLTEGEGQESPGTLALPSSHLVQSDV